MTATGAHLVVVHAPTRPEQVLRDVSDELAARWAWGVREAALGILVLPRLSVVGTWMRPTFLDRAQVLRDAGGWVLHGVPAATPRTALLGALPTRPPRTRCHPALDGAFIPVFTSDDDPARVCAVLRGVRERGGRVVGRPLHQDARTGRLHAFHLPAAPHAADVAAPPSKE